MKAFGAEDIWHTLSVEESASRLQSDIAHGLSEPDAALRLNEYGPNTLPAAARRSRAAIFLGQFRNSIVAFLLAAAVLAFLGGEAMQGAAIAVVILLNAAVGFFTEWNAETAIASLKEQSVPFADVMRSGNTRRIPAAELVPGDVVMFGEGMRVPADGRIIEAAGLEIDEAALTGESQPIKKDTAPVADAHAPIGDRVSMAFLGTSVTRGRGRILVTGTGEISEMGQIASLVVTAERHETPLERRLALLGRTLILLVLGLCAVIVLIGLSKGFALRHILEIGISLAIAAVPEGLQAVATMTLAVGMQRMARMKALIRRLPAVEALGSVTVICTDKTGTLTKNEMTASTIVLQGRRIGITGTGYKPDGSFIDEAGKSIEPETNRHLLLALRAGGLCNDARIERTKAETVLGDPTEAALIVAAEKAGIDVEKLRREWERQHEIPFDSTARRMVTVHRSPDGGMVAFAKGSPGRILDQCTRQVLGEEIGPLSNEERERYRQLNVELASKALRVLALSYRDLPAEYQPHELDGNFIFIGFAGMSDPLREEAKAAIETCRAAGIRTVMITGDQQATAEEIGRQLGLFVSEESRTVHAKELEGLSPDRWQQVAAQGAVFARVTPRHKLELVEALQASGEIVAMTGDGVNDAPALKRADIGIAMGIKGTEVAKESASMVITDDNFATIVRAVEQGRIIYSNILKFIHYLFSCNFAELLTVFIAIMFGLPLPLAALQILWLNMLTDVFPALALALEPSSPGMMNRPPRDPQENLLSAPFIGLIVWQGLLLAAVTLAAFALGLHWHGAADDALRPRTMAFLTLALGQMFHAFNARSQRRSIFSRQLFTNSRLWGAVAVCVVLQLAAVYLPLLQRVLGTIAPSPQEWVVILGASFAPIMFVETVKMIRREAERPR